MKLVSSCQDICCWVEMVGGICQSTASMAVKLHGRLVMVFLSKRPKDGSSTVTSSGVPETQLTRGLRRRRTSLRVLQPTPLWCTSCRHLSSAHQNYLVSRRGMHFSWCSLTHHRLYILAISKNWSTKIACHSEDALLWWDLRWKIGTMAT